VTAVLCVPDDYPGELGGDYPGACAALDLEPTSDGYGLVLGQDDDGARWTEITAGRGVDLVRTVLSVWESGLEAGLELRPDEVLAVRPGWPVACTLGIAGLPAPHDTAAASISQQSHAGA